MKIFLLFVLSVMIFGLTVAQQNYTSIQWDPNNQQLVNILNTGLKEAASGNGDLVWNRTSVSRIETMSSGGATDYYFIVLLDVSDEGDILLDLFLNVDNSGKITLMEYDLHNM